MYTAIILILIAIALWLAGSGLKEKKAVRTAAGILMALFTYLFFQFLDFWGEMLWFEALGYEHRFWKIILARFGFALLGAGIGWGTVFLLTLGLSGRKPPARWPALVVAALVGGIWGYVSWETILLYLNGAATGVKDPILQKDAAFYIFSLIFYDAVYDLFFLLTLIALIAAAAVNFLRIEGEDIELSVRRLIEGQGKESAPLFRSAAVFILVLAASRILERYRLLYSDWGVVSGPGWTDVHVRLPAYAIVAGITIGVGAALFVPSLRRRTGSALAGLVPDPRAAVLAAAAAVLSVTWLLALWLVPALFQWLVVEPNEITMERPYIAHNIRFTRLGFGLHQVEEREFPATERFTRRMVETNPHIFDNIRLWDWRALDAVFQQFQEIRLYYEFVDVDIDRYTVDGAYRQVMVSARELAPENLPAQSQTFVNRRFKYTHGYGITMTDVGKFTPQGLPVFLIKDIPPQSRFPSLVVERPQIYYGELTDTPVIVDTDEKEFDYPRGEENVYIRYDGEGGVPMGNLWRRFLFGWKFDGTRLFLSQYPNPESQIMFHRQILERAQRLAPFLTFEDDPYIVEAQGKLYWMIDAYTTTGYFPYSEPFSAGEFGRYRLPPARGAAGGEGLLRFHGANYVRNAVKAVVDAYHGTVDFYIFAPDDPLIRTWDRIFPGLFKSRRHMPEELLRHIRYPSDMLLVQGLVYAKYHMTDPTVFYNQEDLWVRATEKYLDQVQPVEPYYIMWEPPESDRAEFINMLPFTPKNRQVLIGWIAGMCDPPNYGRFLAYKFPKEKRILGPQQVETKIDQDAYLSQRLSLWDQRGSNVIRGNVLAIPIENTLLYVEPIYLQAETAAYPELRVVVLMHNDRLAYADNFDEAIRNLLREQPPAPLAEGAPPPADQSVRELIEAANQAFEAYLRHLGNRAYGEAGEALEALENTLQRLMRDKGPPPEAMPSP